MTNLHEAAEKNDTVVLTMLLEQGADINEKAHGATPLIKAVAFNAMSAVSLLVEKGAVVDARDITGATALMYACMHGYAKIAGYLIDHGADINAQDRKGLTPIMHGAGGTYGGGMLRFLLTYHPNLEVCDKKGVTILESVAESRWPVQTIMLIRAGADISTVQALKGTPRKSSATRKWIEETAPLFYAAYTGDETGLDAVLRKKPNLNVRDFLNHTPLMCAAEQGHQGIAKMLLEHGANVGDSIAPGGLNSLMIAAGRGHANIIELLVAFGANINSRDVNGDSALIDAVRQNRIAAIKKLLELSKAQGTQLDIEHAYKLSNQKGFALIVDILRPLL